MHTYYVCSKSIFSKFAQSTYLFNKYLFNRLNSFFEQKNNLDCKLLKHFNYIDDEIEEILLPKFVQPT